MTRIPLIDEDIETCGDGCDTWMIIHTTEDQEQLKKQILSDVVKASRYDMLKDRYLNQNKKHFEELCGEYFED